MKNSVDIHTKCFLHNIHKIESSWDPFMYLSQDLVLAFLLIYMLWHDMTHYMI